MSLKGVAKETLQIIADGRYTAPSGRAVSLEPQIGEAIRGTRLWRPAELAELLADRRWATGATTSVEVTGETTQLAAQRLAAADPVVLNFASARNPGGGFINGAKAQEEDLARCSALYPCLTSQRDYYAANRATDSLLYEDLIIYSPRVPFFRVRSRERIEDPFLASVITAPAPNAGQQLMRDPDAGAAIEEALRRRAGYVLALAAHMGHRTLVLGAWGCGVFRNDPAQVAGAFGTHLEGALAGAFERVVFAILDRTGERRVLAPFEARFSTSA